MASNNPTTLFEFEFQREAPISLFYLWSLGHIEAYKLLGLNSTLAEKAFALNNNGIWKAFTQKNNLSKIKMAILKLDLDILEKVRWDYLERYERLDGNCALAFDKEFVSKLICGFIIIFILGDIEGHSLQLKALKARKDTENLFPLLTKSLNKDFVNSDCFPYLSYDEIIARPEFSKPELLKRDKSILSFDGILPIQKFEEFEAFLQKTNIRLNEDENPVQLSGKVAMKGTAIGRAKIIITKSDFSKMEDQDVVVSTMTSPDFLPIINLASAIVTDEGGITSHAAIVARELKKPCIIGTKNATRLLKDGDMVEVDADSGIINILE